VDIIPYSLQLGLEAFLSRPMLLDDAIKPTLEINPAAQRFEQCAEENLEKILGAADR
jgi:hypothetical protein